MTHEFNSSLKGDEEQKQYLLQVIEDDRKQFSLRVVNNLAESYVAMTHEFNSSLKGDEEQKQYLLQVIEDDRKHFFQHQLIKSSAIGAKLQSMPQSE